jgi:hypothetical protein
MSASVVDGVRFRDRALRWQPIFFLANAVDDLAWTSPTSCGEDLLTPRTVLALRRVELAHPSVSPHLR